MSGTIEKVKEKQGILSKIEDVFTLGYSTKEDIRELDKKLHDMYYADFKSMRHEWEDIYLSALNAGQQAIGDDFKKVIQVMDRLAEKINRADYGYAGLMDRKGHIRESELARVFDYDKALGAEIDNLSAAIDGLFADSEADNWTEASAKVKRVKITILELESKWNNREKEFRPLEV